MNSHKQDWEELGTLDPMWAIYSDPARKFGKWDLDEFFATGEQDVDRLMSWVAEKEYPKHRESALDFGCGVGRLTRALARHFRRAYGVDIAGTMVAQATQLNSGISNCEFMTTDDSNLAQFPDHHFDLVYTKWVLQHLPDRRAIRSHLVAFVRCLKRDGLLVFQLRTELSWKARLQLGRKLYVALRSLGVGERFLYGRLGLSPIRMTTIPEAEVIALLQASGARILSIESYSVASGCGKFFFVTK